jgi:hypothetical protein
MEMHPALDSFYGIPQEIRLLYRVLSTLPDVELSGLLQMSKRAGRKNASCASRDPFRPHPEETPHRSGNSLP